MAVCPAAALWGPRGRRGRVARAHRPGPSRPGRGGARGATTTPGSAPPHRRGGCPSLVWVPWRSAIGLVRPSRPPAAALGAPLRAKECVRRVRAVGHSLARCRPAPPLPGRPRAGHPHAKTVHTSGRPSAGRVGRTGPPAPRPRGHLGRATLAPIRIFRFPFTRPSPRAGRPPPPRPAVRPA